MTITNPLLAAVAILASAKNLEASESCACCLGSARQGSTTAQIINGVQKATIVIEERRLSPSTITLVQNIPAELTFLRRGLSECSGDFFLEELRIHRFIETGQRVSVKFTPTKLGAIQIRCYWGKLRGQILVK